MDDIPTDNMEPDGTDCECDGCEWCVAGCEAEATRVKFGCLRLCDECADFGTQSPR